MAGKQNVPWRVGFVQRFEESLLESKFLVLIKDGSRNNHPPTSVPLEQPSFYTKQYRLVLDGIPVNTVVKFVYNLRDGWADFDIYYRRFTNGAATGKDTMAVANTQLAMLLKLKGEKTHHG